MKDNMYFELDQIFFLLNSHGMAAAKRLNPPLGEQKRGHSTFLWNVSGGML